MAPAPNRRAPGLLLAWLVLDVAMAFYLWLNGPSTVSRILLAGGIALLLVALLVRPRATQQPSIRLVEVGIAGILGLELLARVLTPFRPEQPAPTVPVPALAAVAILGLLLWAASRWAGMRAGATIASTASATWLAATGIAVIAAAALAARFVIVAWDIEPGFDVHLIQDAAGRALLAGQNPYTVPTAYHGGYPYWPISAVLAAGGLLFGDARWGLLVADVATFAAFVAIARNVGLPGRLGALAALPLLWNVSGLYLTWQSLPEPAVIALGAVAVAVLTRPATSAFARGILAGVALGLAVATKQLGLGLVPFLALSRRLGQWIAVLVAAAVAAAIVLLFLALAPAEFLEGTVSSHLAEPARDYAINLLDPLPGVLPRLNVPIVVTGIVALGTGLVVRLRWPDALDGWLASSIALLTVAFALIGISFLNYYQIPLALLLILVLIPDGWTADARAPRPA